MQSGKKGVRILVLIAVVLMIFMAIKSRTPSTSQQPAKEQSSETAQESEARHDSSETEMSESSVQAQESEVSESSVQAQESSSEAESSETESSAEEKPRPNLGTCGEIGGRTLLVSIFVNNTRYQWDFEDPDDYKTYSDLYYRLQMAAEWLEFKTSQWGVESEFVWDWYNNKDLYYVANFDAPLDGPTSSRYSEVIWWLKENVDVQALLEKYDADNILFIWCVDTVLEEEENSFAFQFDYSGLTDGQIGYEGMWFNVRHDGFEMGAPTLAHEILHCFGAKDLYYSDDCITQEYVDYVESSGGSDIMYMIYDNPDCVTEQFTEIDAYYVGLTDYSYDVERFGLGPSPHLR